MLARTAAAALIVLSTAGCMTYRGPVGVAAAVEEKAGVKLHREIGFKLGPVTTSLLRRWDAGQELQDLSGIGVAVFEIVEKTHDSPQPILASDLGFGAWRTMIAEHSDGDQLLVLAKPGEGELHEMMLVSIDNEEVVLVRLKGHLDRWLEKTLAGASHDGASGALAALGVGKGPATDK